MGWDKVAWVHVDTICSEAANLDFSTGMHGNHGCKQCLYPSLRPVKLAPAPVVPASGHSSASNSKPPTKEQLAEAKAKALRDLGLGAGGSAAPMMSKAVAAPGAQAKVSSTAAAPEPAPMATNTLASYFMLSSKSDPKLQKVLAAAVPAPTPAAATTSAPPSWQNQLDFPPVALPAAVTSTGPSAWLSPSTSEKSLSSLSAAQRLSANGAATSLPPPPPPRPAAAQAASSIPGMTLAVERIVGLDAEDAEDLSKLTKAQRKNLKRAERKNRLYLRTRVGNEGEGGSDDDDVADGEEGGGSGVGRGESGHSDDEAGSLAVGAGLDRVTSSATTEQDALADAEQAALMEDMFVQALVCRKAMSAMRDVQRLAFSWWQAAAAVQRFGGDIVAGVAWLLERGDAGVEAVAVMPLTSGAERGGWPDMDLSLELRRLSDAQASLSITSETVQAAVVEALGDVPMAIEIMVNQARGSSRSQGSGQRNGGWPPPGSSGGGHSGAKALHGGMQSDPVADLPLGGRFSSGNGLRGMIGSGSQQQLSDLDAPGGGGSRWAFAVSPGGPGPSLSGSSGLLGNSGSSGDTSLTLGDWRLAGSVTAGGGSGGSAGSMRVGSGLDSPLVGSRVGSTFSNTAGYSSGSGANLLGSGAGGGQPDAAGGGSRFSGGLWP